LVVLGGDLWARLQGVPWWNGIGRFCAFGGRLGEGPRVQSSSAAADAAAVAAVGSAGRDERRRRLGDWGETGALGQIGSERAKAWDLWPATPKGRGLVETGSRARRGSTGKHWPWPWLCGRGRGLATFRLGSGWPDQRIGGPHCKGRPKAQRVSGCLADLYLNSRLVQRFNPPDPSPPRALHPLWCTAAINKSGLSFATDCAEDRVVR
jgi:hypothetical protein